MRRRARGRARARLAALALGVTMITSLAACTSEAGGGDAPSAAPLGSEGRFDVRHDKHKVNVYYAAHVTEPETARVVVVMHGTNRNAETYCRTWQELIGERNLVVLCPELSQERFPGVEGYNLGGMVDEQERTQPKDQWSFGVVEAAHEEVVRRLGGKERQYDIFGHSAGAQFVHRYVMFADAPHLRRAVAANAGWYTTLDADVAWPYGLKGAPTDVDVKAVADKDLTLLLGGDDVEDKDLRQDDGADAQGSTRLERGLHEYSTAHQAATRAGVSLGWALQVVPGAAHDHRDMSGEALAIFDKQE